MFVCCLALRNQAFPTVELYIFMKSTMLPRLTNCLAEMVEKIVVRP